MCSLLTSQERTSSTLLTYEARQSAVYGGSIKCPAFGYLNTSHCDSLPCAALRFTILWVMYSAVTYAINQQERTTNPFDWDKSAPAWLVRFVSLFIRISINHANRTIIGYRQAVFVYWNKILWVSMILQTMHHDCKGWRDRHYGLDFSSLGGQGQDNLRTSTNTH